MILIIGISILCIIAICIFLYIENTWIDVENFNYKANIAKQFRICQISDLHSRCFGKSNYKLINIVKQINPDIIVYTGDMIHSAKDDFNISLSLMKELSKYKSFYITGNHEERLQPSIKEEYINSIKNSNVTVLNNEDYMYNDVLIRGIANARNKDGLKSYNAMPNSDAKLKILLAHQPELFKYYKEDIIFSGHAHGGQIRIFNKGLYAPQQGLFPKYTSGEYKSDNKTMYVSRGLGGKDFPFRIFARPHIIVVDIK